MNKHVSSTKRTVTYEMHSEEASRITEAVTEAFRGANTSMPIEVESFLEPLYSVKGNYEYGGH